MFALISTEALEEIGQMQVKQLKNRYNDPSINKRFVVGVDRSKMRLYDVELQAQEEIVDNGQKKLMKSLKNRLLGKIRKIKNMKDFRNSKSNYYVSQDNQDVERPYTVMESKTRKIITRCETRTMQRVLQSSKTRHLHLVQTDFLTF